MRTHRNFQRYALMLASLVLVFAFLANSSPAEAEGQDTPNQNISFAIELDAIEPGYNDPARYYVCLHNRTDAYHPSSVLISGFIYAEAGTEIQNAGVKAGGEWFPASQVYRFVNQNKPRLDDMEVAQVDEGRSAFAFLVDLSNANLEDEYTIEMTVKGFGLTFRDYRITTDSDRCCPYTDIEHALQGYIVKYGESNEGVRLLQENLVSKEYMSESQVSGTYDEITRLAVMEFCKSNEVSEKDREDCRQGVTQTVFMLVSSAAPMPKPSFIKTILDSLQNEVFSLNGFSVELWMIVAAGALLVAVILVLILLLTRKKKKPNPYVTSQSEIPYLPEDPGLVIMEDTDGPTEDLRQIVVEADRETEDLSTNGFQIMLRLFYKGMYFNQSLRLMEGESAVIGRSSEADIKTNPEDKKVSSKHGMFMVRNNTVVYQDDQSRNGTKIDEALYIGKDKDRQSVELPLNRKVTMEIGTHVVWVFIKQVE